MCALVCADPDGVIVEPGKDAWGSIASLSHAGLLTRVDMDGASEQQLTQFTDARTTFYVTNFPAAYPERMVNRTTF